MRRLAALSLLALPLLAACHNKTEGDAVRQTYDNEADRIDQQAAQQPTPVARDIYKDQAAAYREEGKDREKGLEGRSPSPGQGSDSAAPPASPQ